MSHGCECLGLPGIWKIVFLKFSAIMPQSLVATLKRAMSGVALGKEIEGESSG
jgi:hypothetical protein